MRVAILLLLASLAVADSLPAIKVANNPKLVEYSATLGRSLRGDLGDSLEQCDLAVNHRLRISLPLLVNKKGLTLLSDVQGSYLSDFSDEFDDRDVFHNLSVGMTALWSGELFSQQWLVMTNGIVENLSNPDEITGSGAAGIGWKLPWFTDPLLIGVLVPYGPNRLLPVIPMITYARYLGSEQWLLNLNLPRTASITRFSKRNSLVSLGIHIGNSTHFSPKYAGTLELRDVTFRPHLAYEKQIYKMVNVGVEAGYAIPYINSWGDVGYDMNDPEGEFGYHSPYIKVSLFARPTKSMLQRKTKVEE